MALDFDTARDTIRHDHGGQKTLARMRRNPRDWRIEDLKAVADRLGIDRDHAGTSHCVFRHPGREHLSVPAHRPIRPLYVRRFVALVDAVTKGPNS